MSSKNTRVQSGPEWIRDFLTSEEVNQTWLWLGQCPSRPIEALRETHWRSHATSRVDDRIARGAPADDDAQHEQRSLPNYREMVQGFLCERILGLDHLEDPLCHRYPLLELLVLGIVGVHDDGDRNGH